MKIVIAPQAYKGSISGLGVAEAIREGILRVIPDAQTVLVPVADGGDGTLETLVETTGGEIRNLEVTGPLGQQVSADWGALGDGETALVEMARSSGLALVADKDRNPLTATTYGLGEVIKAALDAGFRRFIVGIGGSATNDAGAGMAQALGVRLLDKDGIDLEVGGAALSRLKKIDMSGLDTRIADCEFSVACDVSNPLTGPEGAAAVYGPQKGATPAMVQQLDAALLHLAKIVKDDLDAEINGVQGAGAAGGLGGGLIAFLDATLRAGVDIILDTVELDKTMCGATLVITGEGQMDFQTVYSKAPIGVAWRAKKLGIPVIGISGSLGRGFTDVHQHGIDAASAIVPGPMSLNEASERSHELIAAAAEQAIRHLRVGQRVFGSH